MPTKADIVPSLVGGVVAAVYYSIWNMIPVFNGFGALVNIFVAGVAAAYLAFYAKMKGWGR